MGRKDFSVLFFNFTHSYFGFFLGGGSVFGGGASNPQQGKNIYGLFYHFLLFWQDLSLNFVWFLKIFVKVKKLKIELSFFFFFRWLNFWWFWWQSCPTTFRFCVRVTTRAHGWCQPPFFFILALIKSNILKKSVVNDTPWQKKHRIK